MSGIKWTTVRDGIQSWFVNGTGLPGNHVIWAAQRNPDGSPTRRPSGSFIALRFSLLDWNGFSDWRVYSRVGSGNTGVLTQFIRGPRVALLTATCFQGAPTGGNSTDDTSPVAILNDAMTATGRDDISMALVAAGVGVGKVSGVQSTDGIINTARFESRAWVNVRLNLASEISYVFPTGQGWIETVNVTGTVDANAVSVSETTADNAHRSFDPNTFSPAMGI